VAATADQRYSPVHLKSRSHLHYKCEELPAITVGAGNEFTDRDSLNLNKDGYQNKHYMSMLFDKHLFVPP
jgi:hypothetical protein